MSAIWPDQHRSVAWPVPLRRCPGAVASVRARVRGGTKPRGRVVAPVPRAAAAPDGAVVLKVRDVWPRTAKVYCHRAVGWPDEPDIVERVPVRLVPAARGGHRPRLGPRPGEPLAVRVHQGPRSRRHLLAVGPHQPQARPNVAVPTARAAGLLLEILVDSHERYPWTFGHQQATTRRRALPAGDYAVELDGQIVAAVERKSLADLVVDDDRRQAALPARRPRGGAERGGRRRGPLLGGVQARSGPAGGRRRGLGEAAARFPAVPIVFAETRPLAQEWTYRFLGAALAHHHDDRHASVLLADLPAAGPVPAPQPTTADVRAWAREQRHGGRGSRSPPPGPLGRLPGDHRRRRRRLKRRPLSRRRRRSPGRGS